MEETKNTVELEYKVQGMHCAACELLIEKRFAKFPGIKKVDAIINKNIVKIEVEADKMTPTLKSDLSKLIEDSGYKLVDDDSTKIINWSEFIPAGLIAGLVMVAYILLQSSGLIDVLGQGEISLPFVFLVGVIASLSTCMAVVGGLVLSISANYAKTGKIRSAMAFHASRLISFFVLGGLIGLLGSAFILTPVISLILSLILFVVMLVMGVNLLDIFSFTKKFQFKMPKFIGKGVLSLEDGKISLLTPVLLGAATFVLPCGFTQSMQLYSLTTGSFVNGAITMLVFALGTLPVLALLSFASYKFSHGIQSGLFYKTAGLLVILFAIFNLYSALISSGIISPLI